MTLDDLTRLVATQQYGTDSPSSDTVDEITVMLHHKHLPMLSSLEVITYDSNAQQVEDAV
jgi:hypothetical protein